ncbi:hypothetical protein NQ317_018037 [Molorchus minor]|uniref:RNase H type-1 domain-containing protein n=1 Tax=Molorchus minor TaxID=1323400 RepID=A0ABQ9JS12_9CUCU|nr:hypothetical protein NQ317_018037 [Molorchus minor]
MWGGRGQGRANHSSQSNPKGSDPLTGKSGTTKDKLYAKSESSGLRTAPKLAEVYAILACGLENLKRAPKGRTIQICSDSRAVLLAIESSKVKSRLVLEFKRTLNDLASRNKLILTWVPGHSGVRGNDEADRLAREGVQKLMARDPGNATSKGPYRRAFA